MIDIEAKIIQWADERGLIEENANQALRQLNEKGTEELKEAMDAIYNFTLVPENYTNEVLEVIGQVLIRCLVMGVIVLFIWWGALLLAGDLAYRVHIKLISISISRQQFDIIHYTGMLMTKAAISVLFFFPYVAIRLVIRNRRK